MAEIEKTIVLLSGGLDSAVILADCVAREQEVRALTFNYGQTHQPEIAAAHYVAGHYEVPHEVVELDLGFLKTPLVGGDPTYVMTRTLEEIRNQRALSPAYVPNRNMLFLSYAGAYAEAHGAEAVVIGVNKDDHTGFPDCRPEFIHAMDETLQKVNGVWVIAPLMHKRKIEIARLAQVYGVPIELTRSCYSASPEPCGRCEACLLREDVLS